MATDREIQFASFILKDFQLPEEALECVRQFGGKRLVEVSRDDFFPLLAESSPGEENKLWNVEEIFRRVAEWRQKQVAIESLSPEIQRFIIQPDEKSQEQKTFNNQRQEESLPYEQAPTSDERGSLGAKMFRERFGQDFHASESYKVAEKT
ncbi:uncharacterized protein LOC129737756 [Uranotaenia lowii]|uniref:uncharacterized protein LOC129737756 n=1 Tax=Uranotaenia lowii TaxID=190385 RepID=UPI00247A8734|nr:uncharacterized protein LOC129737756 [Uranotaenia lowii]